VGDEVTADYLDNLTYKPVTQLEGQTSQTCTSGSNNQVQFATSSEVFDDEAWHDTSTNNTRITPNIAGRYQVFGWGVFVAGTSITRANTAIWKNGASIADTGNHKPTNGAGGAATSNTAQNTPFITTFVDMNGSTDYLELTVSQTSTGGVSVNLNNAASGRSTLIVKLHSRT
jgi:hypothetical protein